MPHSNLLPITIVVHADEAEGSAPRCALSFFVNDNDTGQEFGFPVPIAEQLAHRILTVCGELRGRHPDSAFDEAAVLKKHGN